MRDFKLFLSNKGCMDKDIVPSNGCFFNNYDCIQGCENCIKGICYECLIGWEFIEQFNSCIPLCGDAIITYDEECDDGNQFIFDGCHQCKYSCPKDCKLCQFGKCLMCEKNYLVLEGQCQYIPDNIGLAYMERDWILLFIDYGYQQNILQLRNQLSNIDYNNKNYLGYFEQIYLNFKVFLFGYEHNQSKFLQLNNCKVEYFGKCLECQDEYELDFHKTQCIPKCQDGIILSQEICDDGNRIQFDGCYKCQKSCQIECLYCSKNQCYICQEGWQLKDYQCIQICGDGLLANFSNEQCDDLDDLNCINCKYQCDNDCLVCDKFKNCEICSYPFQIKDGKCLPICGDKIITPIFEECDDGNEIPYDGCYECQFQCSLGCIQCKEDNHCEQCDNLYFILDTQTFKCQDLYQNIDSELKQNDTNLFTVQCKENQMFINNQCVNQCGNGILNSQFEQCDDGDNIGGDGCSAFCFEEDSFLCINQENSLSICTFIQKPDFNLILLSDKNNQTKILELSFTQNVYKLCQFPFENIVEIIILPQTEQKITIVPNINITSQLNNPSYKIYIEFLKSVAEPILQIDIQKFCIFNQFELDLTTNTKQIALGTPFLLSEDNQKKVTSVIKMNDAVVYSTASIAGILLLTGNYIVFFNLLDLLQSLSYIKYMQYKFPPHLSQFLETYTKISLQPILDIFKVNEIIAKLNGGTLPSQGQKSKQPQYTNAMNQFYLINAKGCFFSYLASLLTYFMCCLISSIQVSQWLRKRYEKNKFQFFKRQFYRNVQN
ncbi:unnamed protein product [Paramecium pentaurelia]|uniref:Insulin-like growth factor binding protein, N-terminal n=1 Tax=Paramecium pentaurelia TaxID=43138 RepID=A0A8S1WWD5_9CILI|nr:unnamed protein product [Paramecium pentaurelia]